VIQLARVSGAGGFFVPRYSFHHRIPKVVGEGIIKHGKLGLRSYLPGEGR
jgi:hypothetical protein